MALITTADERMKAETGVKMVIFGPHGIGKTSLVWTLDPGATLVIDMEAGMRALNGWPGDSLNVRQKATEFGVHPWDFLRALACIITGPDPAITDPNKAYSQAHHQQVTQAIGTKDALFGKYSTLFFDSITETARYGFGWAKTQPQAFSEKTGKPDMRGAYGLLGQQLVGSDGIFNQLKHCPDKNIIFVGILDAIKDDYGRTSWQPQIDGGKCQRELPGIVDEVISMVELEGQQDGQKFRAFVCHKMNPWGYPAKNRSGQLEMIEEPHLGKVLAKIMGGTRTSELEHGLPSQEAAVEQPASFQTPVALQEPAEQPAG